MTAANVGQLPLPIRTGDPFQRKTSACVVSNRPDASIRAAERLACEPTSYRTHMIL
jgi:hypothetical protein